MSRIWEEYTACDRGPTAGTMFFSPSGEGDQCSASQPLQHISGRWQPLGSEIGDRSETIHVLVSAPLLEPLVLPLAACGVRDAVRDSSSSRRDSGDKRQRVCPKAARDCAE